jgi:Flp pilus assembly pilin Flp
MAHLGLKRFARDNSGAVTVDWVVLTASIIALVLAVFTIITRQSLSVGAEHMKSKMEEAASYAPDFTGGAAVDGPEDPPADG